MGGFFCEGQVVKVGGVPISLIGADHPDRFDHCGFLLGYNGCGDILPVRNVRVKGYVMILRCIVGVGDDCPEAELLVLVLGRRVIAGSSLLVIRHRVCLGPAGHHEGLPGFVDGHILVCAAFRVSVASDLDGIGVLAFGKQAVALVVAGQGPHCPAIPPILQVPVFQQIQIGRGIGAL